MKEQSSMDSMDEELEIRQAGSYILDGGDGPGEFNGSLG